MEDPTDPVGYAAYLRSVYLNALSAFRPPAVSQG
jgi:hypothetical protein